MRNEGRGKIIGRAEERCSALGILTRAVELRPARAAPHLCAVGGGPHERPARASICQGCAREARGRRDAA